MVVKFEPRKGDPQASWDLRYDVSLAADDEKGASSAPIVTSGAAA